MIYRIDIDELYPCYTLVDDGGSHGVDLTEDELSFIRDAESKYFEAQEILRKKIEASDEV